MLMFFQVEIKVEVILKYHQVIGRWLSSTDETMRDATKALLMSLWENGIHLDTIVGVHTINNIIIRWGTSCSERCWILWPSNLSKMAKETKNNAALRLSTTSFRQTLGQFVICKHFWEGEKNKALYFTLKLWQYETVLMRDLAEGSFLYLKILRIFCWWNTSIFEN